MNINLEGQIFTSHELPTKDWIRREFKAKGANFFSDLDGVFLLAIDDYENNEFYLVRDAVGEHPVHFQCDQPRNFASTLAKFKNVSKGMDQIGCDMALRKYPGLISYSYPTLMKNVHSLAPGHYLKIKNSTIEIERYWNPFKKSQDISIIDAPKRFRFLLSKAIAKRKILNDNKRSAFLVSGGLDSSSLFSIAIKDLNLNPLMISYNSDKHPDANELKFQNSLIQNLDPLYEIINIDLILNSDPQLNQQVIESESIIIDPMYVVSKRCWEIAKQNECKNIFLGHWGDQILGPLNAYLHPKNWFRFFNFIKSMHPDSRVEYLKLFLRLIVKKKTVQDYYEELLYSPYHLNCMEQNFKSAKSNGVYQSFPFLDKELIEFLIQIPTSSLLQNGEWKSLLKNAVVDILPDQIITRNDKADYSDVLIEIFKTDSVPDLWRQLDQNALRLWKTIFTNPIVNTPYT